MAKFNNCHLLKKPIHKLWSLKKWLRGTGKKIIKNTTYIDVYCYYRKISCYFYYLLLSNSAIILLLLSSLLCATCSYTSSSLSELEPSGSYFLSHCAEFDWIVEEELDAFQYLASSFSSSVIGIGSSPDSSHLHLM